MIASYISKFEIISLTETWIEEKLTTATEKRLPKDYIWHWIPAVRTKKRGRPAGGIVIGIRKDIETRNFKGKSVGCWAAIEFMVNGKWHQLISIYNNTNIEEIEEKIEPLMVEQVMEGSRTIIGGDLNTRIGRLGAIEEREDRSTMDEKVNADGRKWVNLFNTYGISLLNGNVRGDYKGNFTRMGYKHQEEAVLDYAGASPSMWREIQSFKVGSEAHSDHFPLEITLAEQITQVERKKIMVQKWNTKSKEMYKRDLPKLQTPATWKTLHSGMWSATPKHYRLEDSTNKEWWNEECYKERKKLEAIIVDVRLGNESADYWRVAKREYNKTIKRAKKVYRQNWIQDLERVTNIADGWQFSREPKEKETPTQLSQKRKLSSHTSNNYSKERLLNSRLEKRRPSLCLHHRQFLFRNLNSKTHYDV